MDIGKSLSGSNCNGSQQITSEIIQVPVRISYIDTVKGVAILLMIFGHMRFHNLNWFVYSFHMPLFFILSGFFFNPQKPINKRIKKLAIPYTITALVILGIEISFQFFNYFLSNKAFSMTEIAKNIAGCDLRMCQTCRYWKLSNS